jgi:hypothetical protein
MHLSCHYRSSFAIFVVFMNPRKFQACGGSEIEVKVLRLSSFVFAKVKRVCEYRRQSEQNNFCLGQSRTNWDRRFSLVLENICSPTIIDLPWFQRFKINLWLKAAIDSSSRANQFELGSDPDSVSWLDDCIKALWLVIDVLFESIREL